MMNTLKADVKVGDTLSFYGGMVSITLIEKSGQRARLEIKSEPDVIIDLPSSHSPAQLARSGISRPIQ